MSETIVTGGHNVLPGKPCTAEKVQNCTAVYTKRVDIAEIIEQVRALQGDEYDDRSPDWFGAVAVILEILERYR